MKNRGVRKASLFAFACAALLGAVPAFANGRFPRAQRLVEDPRDPRKLALAATYGVLVTEDRGGHWYHVCDAAFSFQTGFASDPVIGPVADGSLLMGVSQGLTLSNDHGCDWRKVLALPGAGSIDDFAALPSDLNDVIAVVTTFEGGASTLRLHESRDGGSTWAIVGSPLPAAVAYTIDVDPTNRERLFVTASRATSDENDPGLLLVSSDRGGSWIVRPVAGTNIRSSPWIAAVHPKDGNKIFVRTDSWKKGTNTDNAGDSLLYTADAGLTWTELLHAGGKDVDKPGAKLLAFALSPDGSTAVAGYGDIVDATRVVDPEGLWMGLYQSGSDGNYSFGAGAPDAPVPTVKIPVSCATWSTQGIYACFNPPRQAQYLGFTADTTLSTSSITRLMNVQEVLGPPRSCSGRSVSTCSWSTDCAVLGACNSVPPVDPPKMDAGKSEGGTAGSGGAGGSSGGSGPSPSSGGCSVRTGDRARGGTAALSLLLLGLTVLEGRRARREITRTLR